jgi:phospholipid/cholesterol/gamma-HCH transport system substrate-binding protein
MNGGRETRVGLFVAVTLILLGVLIMSLSSQSGLFRQTYTIKTSFSNVQGLAEGAPVRLQGRDIGLVSEIYFAPGFREKPIEVVMEIDKSLQSRIRENSVASIQTMGLLGDKYIELTHGLPEAKAIKEGGVVKSTKPPDLYAVMNKADQILTNIVNISASLDKFTAEFASAENRENFNRTFRSMRHIVEEIEKGKGVMHSLIYEPTPGDAVDSFGKAAADLRNILHDVREGEGNAGRSVRDFSTTMANLKGITTRVKTGPGTLHGLIYEKPQRNVLDNLNAAARNLNEILAKVNRGEGTLGQFVNDPTLYEDLKIITGGAKRSGRVKRVIQYTIKKYEKAEKPAAQPTP